MVVSEQRTMPNGERRVEGRAAAGMPEGDREIERAG